MIKLDLSYYRSLRKLLLVLFYVFCAGLLKAQDNSVTIGGTAVKDNAVLWLNGNGSQGLLLPSVANTGNITSPDAGMIVYQTSDNKIYYRNGSAWVELGAGTGGGATYALQLSGSTIQLLENGTPTATSINIQNISVAGDIIGTIGATSLGTGVVGITQLGNMGLSSGDTGKILQWNGTAWEAVASAGGIAYTAGAGIDITGTVITNTGDTDASDDITTSDITDTGSGIVISNTERAQITTNTTAIAADTDGDATNEIQDLSLSGTTVNISGGTGVDLSPIIPPGGTDDQVASEVPVTAQNGVTSTDTQAALEELQAEITTNTTAITADTDGDATNEIQNLSLSGTTVNISGGTGVDLSPIIPAGGTDDQVASEVPVTAQNGVTSTDTQAALEELQAEITTNTTAIAADADGDATNEIQDLSLSGTTVNISGGTGVDLSPIIPPGGTDDQVASEVPVTAQNGVTSTDTQAALEELQAEITTNATAIAADTDGNPANEIQNLSATDNGTSVDIIPTSGTGVTLTEGTNVTLDVTGNNITINSAGGSLPATTDGQIIISNGTTPAAATVTGDIALTNTGATTVTAIQGQSVNATIPSDNQILQYNSGQWAPATLPTTTPGLGAVLSQSNDAGTTTITNLPTPTAASDAATKGYIDNLAATNNITGSFSSGFTIAVDAISSVNIADGEVQASDIESPGNDKVLTSDAGGVVTWDDKSTLGGVPTLSDGQIVVGNTAPTATTLSGDATLNADGTLTISDDAVQTDDIEGNTGSSNSVLGSANDGTVNWVVGGNNQLVGTNGTGNLTFIDQANFNPGSTVLADGVVPVANSGALVASDIVNSGGNVAIQNTTPTSDLTIGPEAQFFYQESTSASVFTNNLSEDVTYTTLGAGSYIVQNDDGTIKMGNTQGTIGAAGADASSDAKDWISIRPNGAVEFSGSVDLLDDDESDQIAIRAPATVTSSYNFILPPADGTSGQVLSTDGSGNMSWVSGGGLWTDNSPNISFTSGNVSIGNVPVITDRLNVQTGNSTTLTRGLYVRSDYSGNTISYGAQVWNVDGGGTGNRIGLSVNAYAGSTNAATGIYAEVEHDGSGPSYLYRGENAIQSSGVDYGLYLTGIESNYIQGNVGIGTNSAISPIHILSNVGDGSRSGSVFMDINSSNTDSHSYLRFSQDGASLQNPVYFGVDYDNGISQIWNEDALHFIVGTNDIERMRVDRLGNVGIGTSTPNYLLHAHGGVADGTLQLTTNNSGTGVNDGLRVYQSITGSSVINNGEAGSLFLGTNNTTRMTIDPAGEVGIGTTSPSANLHVAPNSTTYAIRVDQGANGDGLLTYVNTTSSTRTVFSATSNSSGMYVMGNGNVGIGTTLPANKLDIEGGAAIGSTYSGSSTAPSNGLIVQGNVGIGDDNVGFPLEVHGGIGYILSIEKEDASNSAYVRFMRQGAFVGSITETGGTVAYNAFTGTHFARIKGNEIKRGTLVSIDGSPSYEGDSQEPIYNVKISSRANDPKVLGTYFSKMEEEEISNAHQIMAVGNGEVYVIDKGENLDVGDLLITSEVPGHAMKDNGQFEISYIIARVAEPVEWDKVSELHNGVKYKKISVFFESFTVNHKADRLESEVKALRDEIEMIKGILNIEANK